MDPSEDDSSLKFKGILGSVCVFSQSPLSPEGGRISFPLMSLQIIGSANFMA